MISKLLQKLLQTQPEAISASCYSDEDKHKSAEIILFESRERRKGQEYRLEHYKKLAIHLLGWVLVFWSVFASEGNLPVSSKWFCVSAIAGILLLMSVSYVIMPKDWTEGPKCQDMIRHYYDAGRKRSELERSLMINLEEAFSKNEARLEKILLALRVAGSTASVSVVTLIVAVNW